MAMLSNDYRIGSSSNPTYRFRNDKISSGTTKGNFTVDILGNELAIDTFSVVVRRNVDAPLVYNPSGTPNAYLTTDQKVYLLKKPNGYKQNFLKDIAPATPVYWYVAGEVMYKGYIQSVQRVGKYLYKITCFSGIGLIDAKTHFGGLYAGESASTVLASIIGNSFQYTVAADVAAVTVYGHLPYDTARNNLHRLLFALGAVLMRQANGNYQVAFLSNAMTNIPRSRVMLNGKTEYTIPADSVEVTEHAFFALNSDEVVSLFDNSNGASVSNQLVVFDNPVHDLTVSGNLTISESSVNHAVVSGVGVLSGKQYTHNMMIIKLGSGNNNVRKVESNELVSFANSYYVAKRVYSYYTSTRKVDAKIVLDSEKPGQLLALRDSFGDPTNAYLVNTDLLVTSMKAAQCRLISGFVPGSNGNNYTNRVLIASNTTWKVPSGITRIRIVLIGGAQGGQGGYDGEAGADNTTTPGLTFVSDSETRAYLYENGDQPISQGGQAGSPGAKAAFLVSDQTVVANDQIAIVVGVGGAGGARNGGLGSDGTPSTAQCSRFGTLSSANGVSTYEGYNDPVSGITFSVDGETGINGGNGGQVSPYGWQPTGAGRGESVETWSGGNGGTGVHDQTDGQYFVLEEWDASAGAGGGAAYGSNGSNGTNGTKVSHSYQQGQTTILEWYLTSGNGGNGANAVAPSQPTIYGQGGNGGNGGGAGGNAGGLKHFKETGYNSRTTKLFVGSGGVGGQGSAGSQGGNGCVLIYY